MELQTVEYVGSDEGDVMVTPKASPPVPVIESPLSLHPLAPRPDMLSARTWIC